MCNKKLSKERYLELKKEFVDVFNDKSKRPKYYGKNGIYKTEGALQFRHFVLYTLIQGKEISNMCHRTDTHKFRNDMSLYFKLKDFWYRNVFSSLTQEEFALLKTGIKDEYLKLL